MCIKRPPMLSFFFQYSRNYSFRTMDMRIPAVEPEMGFRSAARSSPAETVNL